MTGLRRGATRRDIVRGAMVFACPALASAQQGHDGHDHAVPPALEYLAAWPCKRFLALLRETGTAAEIERRDAVTLFAPLDSVWNDAVRGAGRNADAASRLWLARQHVCVGAWAANASAFRLKNLNGETVSGDTDSVAGAGFAAQGMQVRNGYLHLLNGFIA